MSCCKTATQEVPDPSNETAGKSEAADECDIPWLFDEDDWMPGPTNPEQIITENILGGSLQEEDLPEREEWTNAGIAIGYALSMMIDAYYTKRHSNANVIVDPTPKQIGALNAKFGKDASTEKKAAGEGDVRKKSDVGTSTSAPVARMSVTAKADRAKMLPKFEQHMVAPLSQSDAICLHSLAADHATVRLVPAVTYDTNFSVTEQVPLRARSRVASANKPEDIIQMLENSEVSPKEVDFFIEEALSINSQLKYFAKKPTSRVKMFKDRRPPWDDRFPWS